MNLKYLPSRWQIFTLPILATAGEFVIMNIPVLMKLTGAVGFVSVSRTQWLNLPIVQVASFTGMYGVTFLIWLVNAAIAYGIIHYTKIKRISKQAVAVLLVFIAIFIGGWVALPEPTGGDTTVVIIKAKPQTLDKEHATELYLELSEESLKYQPEIILWPMWPKYDLWHKLEFITPSAGENVDFCQENGVYLIDGAGGVAFPDGRTFFYNSPYHMMHFLDGIVPFNPDKLLPDLQGFRANYGKFGILGCMEGAYTIPTRKWVEGGTYFLPITSGEPLIIGAYPDLHASNAVFRAVEHHIYTGTSYLDRGLLIDPYGRIIEDTAPEPEIFVGKVAFPEERPFYSKYGDIFSYILLVLTAALIGHNIYLKRKSPCVFCKKCRAWINKGTKECPECGKKQ